MAGSAKYEFREERRKWQIAVHQVPGGQVFQHLGLEKSLQVSLLHVPENRFVVYIFALKNRASCYDGLIKSGNCSSLTCIGRAFRSAALRRSDSLPSTSAAMKRKSMGLKLMKTFHPLCTHCWTGAGTALIHPRRQLPVRMAEFRFTLVNKVCAYAYLRHADPSCERQSFCVLLVRQLYTNRCWWQRYKTKI